MAALWAFPVMGGEDMAEYEEAFGIRMRERHYDYSVVAFNSTVPAHILHEGEQVAFTLQLQSHADGPIKGDYFVDVIAYQALGIPGDIWLSRAVKTADVARLPISVDLPKHKRQPNHPGRLWRLRARG
jgi:hypothetical protein